MSNFRAVLTFAVTGALLGIIVATLASPSVISSQLCGFTSDVQIQRPCLNTVQSATSTLIHTQLYGGAGGLALGIAAGVFFSVRRGKKASSAAPKG
jgi:hypothetical protein